MFKYVVDETVFVKSGKPYRILTRFERNGVSIYHARQVRNLKMIDEKLFGPVRSFYEDALRGATN